MKLKLLSKMRQVISMIALLCLGVISSQAQTTLAAGDIMFIGVNSDGTGSPSADEFAVLFLEPVTTGTEIYFTDMGYTGNSAPYFQQNPNNGCGGGTGAVSDGMIKWTATGAVSAGTQLVIRVNAASGGITASTGSLSIEVETSSAGQGMNLSSAGEAIHAFQGTLNGSDQVTSATMLASLDYDALWTGTVTTCQFSSTVSEDPGTGFEVEFSTHDDNGYYSGSMTGSKAALQDSILNSSKWTKNSTSGYTLPIAGSFTVGTTDYYYDGSGSINSTSNWGTNTDGTGSNPAGFNLAGFTYHVANTSGTVNTPGNWDVGSSTGGLEIGSGIVVGINGNTLSITGALSGSGTLAGGSTSDLTLTGTVGTVNFTSGSSNRTLHDLTLSASTTATLGTATSITGGSTSGTVIVGSGSTLTTGGNLTLSSNSLGTARIGNSAGSISGNVTVERYIPGKRAFRFLGHPFTTSQALTSLTDDIDITGSGGAANGFTTTSSNNPSAFWFDPTTADTAVTGANTGWTAFTNANGVSSNSWDKGEMIRILVRGTLGQGLTGGSYTPSATTLDMTGGVNQGTQVLTLTKGSGSTFVSCGNPFPSGVQMSTVAKGSNIGANYYVWDATSGAAGAYVTNAFASSYILPAFGALFTTASANSSNTLTFEEADKASPGASVFKGTASANWVELIIEDSSTLRWDRLLLNFDDNAMDVQDNLDATKLYNPGLDFFTLSKDDERLAIDVRPYSDSASIPLGLTAYNRYNRYKIKTGDFDIPAGTKLFLHDKYLNKKEEMKAGFEYVFDVTTDTLSQGNQRFEINMEGKPTNSVLETVVNTARMQLIPNPAQNQVKISFDKLDGNAQVKVVSLTGQVVFSQMIETSTGSVIVPLQNVPSGIYIVSLQSKNARFTEKLIKE